MIRRDDTLNKNANERDYEDVNQINGAECRLCCQHRKEK